MAYGSFEGYNNYIHYEVTKMTSNGKKDFHETMQIAFPFFSRDQDAELADPELRNVGNRVVLYCILTWLALVYIIAFLCWS